MKTYQNEHVTVVTECSVHLLQQTWVGIPSSENFRDGSLATIALARRHQIKRWRIDLRQLRVFNPVDLHWFIQHCLTPGNSGLPRKARIAIILNDLNQFGKMGSDLIIRAMMAENNDLACRYFLDNDDTQHWLMLDE